MGGKIIPKIRLTSAKNLVEVEAELGKKHYIGGDNHDQFLNSQCYNCFQKLKKTLYTLKFWEINLP